MKTIRTMILVLVRVNENFIEWRIPRESVEFDMRTLLNHFRGERSGVLQMSGRFRVLSSSHIVRQVLEVRQQRGGAEDVRQRSSIWRQRQQVPHRELRLSAQRGLRGAHAARATHQHAALRPSLRHLPRRKEVRRLLELLERRGLALPMQPWTGLRPWGQGVHVGRPSARVQKRRYWSRWSQGLFRIRMQTDRFVNIRGCQGDSDELERK